MQRRARQFQEGMRIGKLAGETINAFIASFIEDGEDVFSTPEALKDLDALIRREAEREKLQAQTKAISPRRALQRGMANRDAILFFREATKGLVDFTDEVVHSAKEHEKLDQIIKEQAERFEDSAEGMEEAGVQGSSLNDVMSGLGDIITGIGPAAQNTFGIFGTSLVQSTQTGQKGFADLLATSQNLFRTFLTDTQRTTRSAAGAFQNFARSARGAVSDSLFALLRGDMKRFGDIWKNFANSLLDSLVNTGARFAQSSLFRFLGIDGSTKRLALVA